MFSQQQSVAMREVRLRPSLLLLRWAAILSFFSGCAPAKPVVISEGDLVGKWLFEDAAQEVLLTVKPGLTYTISTAAKNSASVTDIMATDMMLMLLATESTGALRLTADDKFSFLMGEDRKGHVSATVTQLDSGRMILVLGDEKNGVTPLRRLGGAVGVDPGDSE